MRRSSLACGSTRANAPCGVRSEDRRPGTAQRFTDEMNTDSLPVHGSDDLAGDLLLMQSVQHPLSAVFTPLQINQEDLGK